MESPGIISFKHDKKNQRLLHISWTPTTNSKYFYLVKIEESTGYVTHLNLPAGHSHIEYSVKKDGPVLVEVAVSDNNGIIGLPSKAKYIFSVAPGQARDLCAKVHGTFLQFFWSVPEGEEDAEDVKYHCIVRHLSGADYGQTVTEFTTKELSRQVELPKEGIYEISVTPRRLSRWYGAEDTSARGLEISEGPSTVIVVNSRKDTVLA